VVDAQRVVAILDLGSQPELLIEQQFLVELAVERQQRMDRRRRTIGRRRRRRDMGRGGRGHGRRSQRAELEQFQWRRRIE
jgi:hypothetical protein